MATYVKFHQFVEDLAYGYHTLTTSGNDTLKVALSDTAPSSTNVIFADITEITAENGYSAGGTAASLSTSKQSTGKHIFNLVDVTFTASTVSDASGIGPFRYVVLYNDTSTDPVDPLISYWDYGSSITLATTETFTVDFDGTNGVFTIE